MQASKKLSHAVKKAIKASPAGMFPAAAAKAGITMGSKLGQAITKSGAGKLPKQIQAAGGNVRKDLPKKGSRADVIAIRRGGSKSSSANSAKSYNDTTRDIGMKGNKVAGFGPGSTQSKRRAVFVGGKGGEQIRTKRWGIYAN